VRADAHDWRGVSFVSVGEYDDGAGAELRGLAFGPGDFGHFGLRPLVVVHVGDGLGEGDGDTVFVGLGDTVFVGLGDVVVDFVGAVVFGAAGAVLVLPPVRPPVEPLPKRGGTVSGRLADGTAVGVGVGVADGRRPGSLGRPVTSTLRASWLPEREVEGTMPSGRPWKPMITSRPVATVASSTITTLDSRGPRWARVLTAATSPWDPRCGFSSATTIGSWFYTLYPRSHNVSRRVPVRSRTVTKRS
jgi:hypothetical protein